jgi:monooxygenase
VRTYYRRVGHGPPLLLLHGLGLSHLSWAATAAFAEHFTVYILDLPGFGYSDKPTCYGSAQRLATFVDRFLASLALERVTVVGHSMGGTVALWLAVEHPARVERLVVANAAEIGQPAAVFRILGTPLLGDLLLRASTPATMRLIVAHAYVHKHVVTAAIGGMYNRFIHSPGARQALIAHARAYQTDKRRLLPRLRTIGAPALIVWTDRDPFWPLGVAHDLRSRLPGADLAVIADAGHVPQEEQPERFSGTVLRWLASPTGASGRPGSYVTTS